LGQQASQEIKWILYFYLKKKKKAPDGKKTKKKCSIDKFNLTATKNPKLRKHGGPRQFRLRCRIVCDSLRNFQNTCSVLPDPQ
jgi:hypothetical protein